MQSLQRLQEHYSELLNQNIHVDPQLEQYIQKMRKPTCQYLDEPPTFEEFNKIIKSAKNHKTGTDIQSVEILK